MTDNDQTIMPRAYLMTEAQAHAELRRVLESEGVDGFQRFMDEFREVNDHRSRRADVRMAWALIAAGWSIDGLDDPTHAHDLDVMSWSWRRPGMRPGKPGRLYRSTNQAHNALMRETDSEARP